MVMDLVLVMAFFFSGVMGELQPMNITTIPDLTFRITAWGIDVGPQGDVVATDSNAVWRVNMTTSPPTKQFIAGSSERGYAEGIGSQALFKLPNDVIFFNETHVLVSDTANHCLRLVNLQTGRTSTYAGRCEHHGNDVTNVFRLNMRFWRTHSLLKLGEIIYICDEYNDAVYLLQDDTVRTVYSGHPLNSPNYMSTCDGTQLYISILHGVVKIDLKTMNATIVAGLAGWRNKGSLYSDPSSQRFNNPAGIIALTERLLIVTDLMNYRLRLIDLETSHVSAICSGRRERKDGNKTECALQEPWALQIYGDSILIGEYESIRKLPLKSLVDESYDAVCSYLQPGFGFNFSSVTARYSLTENKPNPSFISTGTVTIALTTLTDWTPNSTSSALILENTTQTATQSDGTPISDGGSVVTPVIQDTRSRDTSLISTTASIIISDHDNSSARTEMDQLLFFCITLYYCISQFVAVYSPLWSILSPLRSILL